MATRTRIQLPGPPPTATPASAEPRELFGGKAPKALPWNPLPHMEEYLENLEADQCAPGYVAVTRVGLTHFGNFAKEEGLRHPDEIRRQHLLRFQVYLNDWRKGDGNPLSQSYRQQLMKYVRAWVNWLDELEHIERNPWVRIRVGRTAKKPKPLEIDEVAALFAAHRQQAFSIPAFYFHRREVILAILLGWGLRISELASLDVTHMDMRRDWIVVRNKGGGEKTLPYGAEMQMAVARYLQHRSKHAQRDEDALLINQEGRRLSTEMIRRIVTECGARAGIALNPHRLRDTFGTTMLDNDVPVERIMKMMGHTNQAQTLAYSRVSDPTLKQSHDLVMTPLLKQLLGGELP